jgi:type IV pilus assembly protein PilQ
MAMERQGKGRTISSPKILTLDNQQATIKQVTKIPYQVIEDGTVSIKTEEAGIELSVTPQITRDERIRMKIHAEKGAPDWSNTVSGNPAIDINTADTELFVNDGQTIVIGGVLKSEETETEDRIPYFNRIPLLGWLFKQKFTYTDKDELLIFITPKIIKLEDSVRKGA